MEMTCPKCQAAMRQYERNGVTIDQCTECRGLFLDRGELEKLVDAEAAFNESGPPAAPAGAPPPAPSAPPAAPPPAPGAPPAAPPPAPGAPPPMAPTPPPAPAPAPGYGSGYGHGYGHDPYYKRKKRRSFLEELFD